MIIRIVKLTIQPEELEKFKSFFIEMKTNIRTQEGCFGLKLLQGDEENILLTLSRWESEEALNTYRSSELFRGFWPQVKLLFAEKPETWSFSIIDQL